MEQRPTLDLRRLPIEQHKRRTLAVERSGRGKHSAVLASRAASSPGFRSTLDTLT
ncbi:hypothetical protein ACGF0K_36960 [Streptomyces sp. NPDC048156]|uniref:hypothetical protein n=1 Tax=Streptomyces sp. NPDC048156 TaxID=3365502 RepID=UPI0037157F2D